MSLRDFDGKELAIGDTVLFVASAVSLQRGTVTGFSKSHGLPGVQIVSDNKTTHTVASWLCGKFTVRRSHISPYKRLSETLPHVDQ